LEGVAGRHTRSCSIARGTPVVIARSADRATGPDTGARGVSRHQ
jgi:hypothetical protein